jgi:tellurite resistance protein TerA
MAIELKKGAKISLEKKSNKALGEILVNLKWNQGNNTKKGIDLDLACLYELKDGSKSYVQALGNSFGSLNKPPFILLESDDRTGESMEGENLRINGNEITKIKRILIYTFIYDGVANWKQTDGVITIKYLGSQDIIIRMDEYDSKKILCGIAMLENYNNETFTVEKLIKFFNRQSELDRAYNWGMLWSRGKKD